MGQSGRHHDIFCGANTGKVQVDSASGQPGSNCFNIAMAHNNFRPQSHKTLEVKVNWPGADIASPWQGDPGTSHPGKQGTHDQERCPHLAHQFIGGFIGADSAGINLQLARSQPAHSRPQLLQELTDSIDIVESRHFLKLVGARCQKRGSQRRQSSVFCAIYFYCPSQGVATPDKNLFHNFSSCRNELLR